MKSFLSELALFLFIILLYPLTNSIEAQPNTDILFQFSTINALLNGVYDGELTMLRLKGRGDFGIGTFNSLDGEMIVTNGKIYKIKSDGKAYDVSNSEKTPFASITFFDADTTLQINNISYKELEELINKTIPTKNIFYAVRIEGEFSYVKTRSVPKQVKPYKPLVEIVKTQPTFEYEKINGTIVGFRSPSFVSGINVPGYHFHFINTGRTFGGHVLDVVISNAKLSLDYTHTFYMSLPETEEFYKTELESEKKEELEKVEK